MAEELDDGEFWLPSEFLTDDDLLIDFKIENSKTKKRDDFSYEFVKSFGFSSDLSSPVESIIGSTETESDEDEFLSGLTRKMAHPAKGLKQPGSPQSTLCGFKPGSSQSSPQCASRVSSPPGDKDGIGWDLLYAAAGEVARMRKAEWSTPFGSTNLYPPPPRPSSNNPNPTPAFHQNFPQTEAHRAYLQLQAIQFQRMKQQQMMKNSVWGQGKTDYQFHNGEVGRTQRLSMAAWPTLQQSQQQKQNRSDSGMKAVFLGETGTKKKRTGTGVFLPRAYGNDSTETRKKPGCSTVLLPQKVVHALNLNLGTIDAQPNLSYNRNFTPEYDAALKQRNNALMAKQRRGHIPQHVMNQELGLPQEWTY